MSSYTILSRVAGALRHILWEAFDADAVIRPIVGSEAHIVFLNPTETARDSAHRLSLWLYQVTENPFVKNQPPVRVNDNDNRHPPAALSRRTPLALNQYFLATPFAATSEANHLLLGKTMQVMYDNAIIILRDAEEGIAEELRIILCRLSLEELTRIWEALKEPYRLSVCYQIQVTRIDSERVKGSGRVLDREAWFVDEPQRKVG